MKKILCVLFLLTMMFPVFCGIAEESAIDKLDDFERNIFDSLLIMLKDFKDPSSVRILELPTLLDYSDSREKYLAGEEIDGRPDVVCVRLTGNNSFGGKDSPYFMLCCYTWNEEPRTELGKSFVDLRTTYGASMRKAFNYKGTAGDYYEVNEPLMEMRIIGVEKIIGRINRALKEYWEILGF